MPKKITDTERLNLLIADAAAIWFGGGWYWVMAAPFSDGDEQTISGRREEPREAIDAAIVAKRKK